MKNNPWKKFIIVVSALLIVIMVCVTTNLITNSITNSLRMQPLGGVQQQQGVVNGGGFAQNNGGQMGVTPDSNGSFGGDSSLGGNSADQGVTAAPQGGNSGGTQTSSNDPLKMNKSQLINYYNSCLKKSYSQKMNATKVEQVDVKPSGVDIGNANLNVDSIANALIANNTKNNGIVQTKSFVNGKATDDGSPVEKFVLPANLYDAAVKSISIKQNGKGYQIIIVLNEETCAHNGTAKYNASCAWPLDVGVINFELPGFGNAVDIQQCTFRYTGTTITAMIDGQGRVTDTRVEMPLTVTNAVAKAIGITIKVAKIEGKWTCVNSMRFA
ncbi:MAG: hypothetical protein U0K91_09435 [Acutalibacteraceae bacterium]|nr:hypothetical protein [Acutalibacteraceae bacterium]